ncbi:MAG: D-2-hydroxyacid dehydrogenase [Chloroflexi bacterium]|nr:D-2-hydroxyacid dehydrogenase [Chloroflexota bacterium]
MKTILLGFEPNILSASELAQIQALAPDHHLLVTTDQQTIEQALDEIEIAFKEFPQPLITKAPKLRWLQLWSAGADWLLRYPEITKLDLTVTNSSGVHAIPISEHILAYLFAFARDLPNAIRSQTEHKWRRSDWKQIFELAGKTMVLIGVGAIGERTASMANALGMRVLGVRRDPSASVPGVEAMCSTDQLLEVLPQADFVVLTVPVTPETKSMMGETELRTMKTSAYIVNIGRGGTIDEAALIRALQEKWIAGAGLDVFANEPLPADSPLWAMENVIVTSHYAGNTPKYDERAMAIFLDNLQHYMAGEPLRNVVDKRLGY